jgi:hypothetical protein
MEPTWLAIVTFGAPNMVYRKVWRSTEATAALRVASRLVGSGSCTDVRIYCTTTRRQARLVDISDGTKARAR